jgi:hypothetical protein
MALTPSALGVLLACSGSTTDPGGTDGAVRQATLDSITQAYCKKLTGCFGLLGQTQYGTEENCRARLSLEVNATVKGPGANIQESQASACLKAAEAATCEDITSSLAACQFKGTLTDGAACANDAQCASGVCYVPDKAACGTCKAMAKAGGDCSATKCEPGLTCNKNQCVARAKEGATCNDSVPCAVGLSCTEGKCTKGLGAKAACKVNGAPCDTLAGLYCKPASLQTQDGTCEPLTLAKPGAACGLSLSPLDFAVCVDRSDCIGASQGKQGVCTAHLNDGAECGDGKPSCLAPAQCRNGKCAVLDPTICK